MDAEKIDKAITAYISDKEEVIGIMSRGDIR